ncbi:MAG: helix-turn-helix transcriptional regulator [Muribaculaceae bacterium]|nr:helix-turn-helix transcriptional regulator [Muribaculaceae bacterium]
MVKNNHLLENRKALDKLLRTESRSGECVPLSDILAHVRFLARIENVLAVVSDMADGKSHIITGGFARNLDIGDYRQENSIWENRILSLMSADEQDEKYIAELRFYHYLRHLPKSKKSDYYLISRLRFRFVDGDIHDVLHRMYYVFDESGENVRYAICIYSPLPFDFKGKSFVANSITGLTEELTALGNGTILSCRQCQVLKMIDIGMKSAEIAAKLNISIHTVSRHRQEIICKLQVKNTHEACRIAKSMGIL